MSPDGTVTSPTGSTTTRASRSPDSPGSPAKDKGKARQVDELPNEASLPLSQQPRDEGEDEDDVALLVYDQAHLAGPSDASPEHSSAGASRLRRSTLGRPASLVSAKTIGAGANTLVNRLSMAVDTVSHRVAHSLQTAGAEVLPHTASNGHTHPASTSASRRSRARATQSLHLAPEELESMYSPPLTELALKTLSTSHKSPLARQAGLTPPRAHDAQSLSNRTSDTASTMRPQENLDELDYLTRSSGAPLPPTPGIPRSQRISKPQVIVTSTEPYDRQEPSSWESPTRLRPPRDMEKGTEGNADSDDDDDEEAEEDDNVSVLAVDTLNKGTQGRGGWKMIGMSTDGTSRFEPLTWLEVTVVSLSGVGIAAVSAVAVVIVVRG
ncbi:uncharacterized protein L969DRAFT_45725 [Mixia osmundae IAM 14324]|uniref:Uncharacterized protein n=1 Tax=Mixia osmundae (strain CBS 9802 / IAM 14324 / JCM 22182 / KY 12970) TaxID=764103 RepID=G7DYE1_MIXOS|nr:uncharacterized protein L969DRAFT_45725 [Mixia osmundae IAM 14324]KEI41503.1 hypothetical protein L969DRAFT_45725 [Mixia osmundae IAM 14324]GAA95601.1 hypothetical protein E5Q_02257 [Mixia osmundae IAM 14324]